MSDQAQTEYESEGVKELSVVFFEASVASTKHSERNEDAVFNNGRNLAMVLDGVGGVKHGDIASSIAKDVVIGNLSDEEDNVEILREYLVNVIAAASESVEAEAGGGKTTIVVAKIVNVGDKRVAVIGSVGDSRAYLLRDGGLTKVTEDDDSIRFSILTKRGNPEELRAISEKLDNAVSAEELTEEEMKFFRQRNQILQSLGQNDAPDVHLYLQELKQGDKLVLTSDGVHDNLTTGEILKVVAESGDVAAKLADKAKTRSSEDHFRSKPDDISAVVMEFK